MAKEHATVRYVGRDRDGVSVRNPDGSWSPVAYEGTFETTADHAASLLTQQGEWERVASPRTPPKTKEEVNDG